MDGKCYGCKHKGKCEYYMNYYAAGASNFSKFCETHKDYSIEIYRKNNAFKQK